MTSDASPSQIDSGPDKCVGYEQIFADPSGTMLRISIFGETSGKHVSTAPTFIELSPWKNVRSLLGY